MRAAFLRAAADRCREAIREARAADRDQRAYRMAIRRATSDYHAALAEASGKFLPDGGE
jgi:hypothetical protein